MQKPQALFLCLTLLCVSGFSQQAYYMNPAQSLLAVNPSFAGTNGGLRLQTHKDFQALQYRGSNYQNALESNSHNAFDAYIKPARAGVALSYNSQVITQFEYNQHVSATYAQHISFFKGDLKLIPSVQIGYSLLTKKYYDYTYGFYPGSKLYDFPDYTGGVLVNVKSFYVGVSQTRYFNTPVIIYSYYTGNYRFLRTNNFYMSGNVAIGNKTRLNLSFWHQQQDGSYSTYSSSNQLCINAAMFNHILLGIGFEVNNNAFFTAGYRHNYFTLQVGYEPPYSAMFTSDSGKYKFSASFNLRNEEKRKVLTNFETI